MEQKDNNQNNKNNNNQPKKNNNIGNVKQQVSRITSDSILGQKHSTANAANLNDPNTKNVAFALDSVDSNTNNNNLNLFNILSYNNKPIINDNNNYNNNNNNANIPCTPYTPFTPHARYDPKTINTPRTPQNLNEQQAFNKIRRQSVNTISDSFDEMAKQMKYLKKMKSYRDSIIQNNAGYPDTEFLRRSSDQSMHTNKQKPTLHKKTSSLPKNLKITIPKTSEDGSTIGDNFVDVNYISHQQQQPHSYYNYPYQQQLQQHNQQYSQSQLPFSMKANMNGIQQNLQSSNSYSIMDSIKSIKSTITSKVYSLYENWQEHLQSAAITLQIGNLGMDGVEWYKIPKIFNVRKIAHDLVVISFSYKGSDIITTASSYSLLSYTLYKGGFSAILEQGMSFLICTAPDTIEYAFSKMGSPCPTCPKKNYVKNIHTVLMFSMTVWNSYERAKSVSDYDELESYQAWYEWTKWFADKTDMGFFKEKAEEYQSMIQLLGNESNLAGATSGTEVKEDL